MNATVLAAAYLFVGQSVPVWDGRLLSPELVKGGIEYCNIGVVRAKRSVIVHAGPERIFYVIGQIKPNATVYTCNETTDRKLGLRR